MGRAIEDQHFLVILKPAAWEGEFGKKDLSFNWVNSVGSEKRRGEIGR